MAILNPHALLVDPRNGNWARRPYQVPNILGPR